MPVTLIGREEECRILQRLLNSKQPEFLALYGRRRVGKTFLIREYFQGFDDDLIFMYTTGSKNGPINEQIKHFTTRLSEAFYHGVELKPGKNWDKSFSLLTKEIDAVPKNKKIVIFMDEFPWMATKRSRLLANLDYYWNQYWSRDPRIKLIICGSAASWVIDNIINNRGGLHNRITKQMLLEPLNLHQTKRFLTKQNIKLNNKQILHLYMAVGGIPYYLTHIQKGLTAQQNIDELAFSKNGLLLTEFDKLFASLFDQYELCEKIVRTIAEHQYGIGQAELLNKLDGGIKGGSGLKALKQLTDAGFIMSFMPHQHRKRGIYYKVIDEYTLFYLRWVEPIKNTLAGRGIGRGYWEKQQSSAAWNSWAGFAFESICYKHLPQISRALKLSPAAIPNVWRYAPIKKSNEDSAQIDLLFDRPDAAITICEIKNTIQPFALDKSYAHKLLQRIDIFKQRTRSDKQIFVAFISASGLKETMYSEEIVDAVVTLEDLFTPNT